MLWALLITVSAQLSDGGAPEEGDAGAEVHEAVPVQAPTTALPLTPLPQGALTPVGELDGGVPEAPSKLSLRGAAEADLGLFPSGFGENGLDFTTAIRPSIGFFVGDVFGIELGSTFRIRIIDTPAFNRPTDVGGFLRGADWDELSDFGQILKKLQIGNEQGVFHVKAEPTRKKSLGLGHLLWRYSNQANVDYHPTGAQAVLRAGPIRAELFASDILGARLFAGEVAWDIGGTFSSLPAVKDRYVLSFQVAHDFNLAGRPFRFDPSLTPVTPVPITLLHLDASAVLVRSAELRWMVMLGMGTRANATADLGFLVGTTLDANVKEVGFSTRLELRKQAGGFRHGFFGPMYELQRFVDIGFRGPGLGDAVLPDGLSGFGELRVGIGPRISFDLAAEYFFWNRLDLDGGFSLALFQDWFFLTARTTVLGLAQSPRWWVTSGFRARLFPSFYVLGEAGTVFFPQPDGSLIRGFAFSAGVGVDFER